MHHKYHTEGLVVGSVPSSEANKFIFILTRDFGLLGAHAQGIRSSHSKLRFGLQDFSSLNLSLVHGKSGWKIVNAKPLDSWFEACKDNPSKLYVCAHTISFIRKFVKGEEKDEDLFDLVKEGLGFLSKEDLSYKEVGTFQCLMMFRILKQLGYIGDEKTLEYILKEKGWRHDVMNFVATHRTKMLSLINKALKESHL